MFELLAYCGGFQSTFAEIGVPEEAGGDGAPRTPGLAEGFEFFRRGTFAKALHFLHRRGQRKIAGWPDVRAAQRAQEINVGGPAADALESHEHFVRGVVREVQKITQVEVAAREGFSQQTRVQGFLAAETNAQQFRVIQLQESRRSQWLDDGLQAIKSSFRRG